LLLVSEEGQATMFDETEINPVGVKAGGIKAIAALKQQDRLAKILAYDQDEKGKIVMLTKQSNLRIFDINYISKTPRLGKVQFVFQSFKSEPHTLVYWRKLNRQDEFLKLSILLSNKTLFNIETNDYAPTPVDKYAKKNLSVQKGTDVLGVYHEFLPRIDTSFKTYASPSKPENKDSKVEQLSLFDGDKKSS
jgi:DNA gyrase/topoisomerase IV subunit A